MPLPTNRQAPGLLSFFGVKNGGKNPLFGMDQLISTCDLLDWLLADPLIEEELISTGTAVNGSGNNFFSGSPFASFTVPQGQFWILKEAYCSTLQLGAGQAISGACAILPPVNTAGPIALHPGNSATNGSTPDSLIAAMPPAKRFLRAGTTLGFVCNRLTAGPITVNMMARIVRVQI